MDQVTPGYPPSAGDAWTTLRTLHECVVHSLAGGHDYDLLLRAARDAESLLARYALSMTHATVSDPTPGPALVPPLRVSSEATTTAAVGHFAVT